MNDIVAVSLPGHGRHGFCSRHGHPVRQAALRVVVTRPIKSLVPSLALPGLGALRTRKPLNPVWRRRWANGGGSSRGRPCRSRLCDVSLSVMTCSCQQLQVCRQGDVHEELLQFYMADQPRLQPTPQAADQGIGPRVPCDLGAESVGPVPYTQHDGHSHIIPCFRFPHHGRMCSKALSASAVSVSSCLRAARVSESAPIYIGVHMAPSALPWRPARIDAGDVHPDTRAGGPDWGLRRLKRAGALGMMESGLSRAAPGPADDGRPQGV